MEILCQVKAPSDSSQGHVYLFYNKAALDLIAFMCHVAQSRQLLHFMVGEFNQRMLNNECTCTCITLSFFTDDILENVDESTIPDTLVQRLQEEK